MSPLLPHCLEVVSCSDHSTVKDQTNLFVKNIQEIHDQLSNRSCDVEKESAVKILVNVLFGKSVYEKLP